MPATPKPTARPKLKVMRFTIKKRKKFYGRLNVARAAVYIRIGGRAYRKARVSGKKFSYIYGTRLKKNTRVTVMAKKGGYKTLKKVIRAR